MKNKVDVLIVSTNRNTLPVPVMPYGACLVAEATEKAGYRVEVLDLMFKKDPLYVLEHKLQRLKPDVVGLSIRNIDNNDMQSPAFYPKRLTSILERIRMATNAPVVLGGAALSVMPDELLRFTGAEYALYGAGEAVFQKLLERLFQGKNPEDLPGVAWIKDGLVKKTPCITEHTADCPVPAFHRWIDVRAYLSRLSSVPVQTKIGCHFQCVYCTYRKAEGTDYQVSSPESVAETVRRLSREGLRDIEFVDNVFNSPYDHALAVCEALIPMKGHVRFQSLELNPVFIDDPLLDAMEKAGFKGIGITVESASDKVLCGLGKGFNSKDVQRASEIIARHRIPCVWIFMLGGPGETEETVRETLRFAERAIRPQDVAFFNIGIRIYPNTTLEYIARKEGILSLSKDEMLEPIFYLSPGLDFKWLIDEMKRFMGAHMNVINSESLGLNLLPFIQRLAYSLKVKPPLWRYTRYIRRSLRLFGVNA